MGIYELYCTFDGGCSKKTYERTTNKTVFTQENYVPRIMNKYNQTEMIDYYNAGKTLNILLQQEKLELVFHDNLANFVNSK